VSLHRYLYADAGPINKSDPTGLSTLQGKTNVVIGGISATF